MLLLLLFGCDKSHWLPYKSLNTAAVLFYSQPCLYSKL